jgi:hypothetical protein
MLTVFAAAGVITGVRTVVVNIAAPAASLIAFFQAFMILLP